MTWGAVFSCGWILIRAQMRQKQRQWQRQQQLKLTAASGV